MNFCTNQNAAVFLHPSFLAVKIIFNCLTIFLLKSHPLTLKIQISGGSWGWQTQLDHSQVCTTCISRAYTCIHVKYTCIHVKYTCYTPGNSLVVFATLKKPHFDSSNISEASEIFLSLICLNLLNSFQGACVIWRTSVGPLNVTVAVVCR